MPKTQKTQPLLAWHGDAKLQKAAVATMAAHRKADTLVKGLYWKNGKGCAVGGAVGGVGGVVGAVGGVETLCR